MHFDMFNFMYDGLDSGRVLGSCMISVKGQTCYKMVWDIFFLLNIDLYKLLYDMYKHFMYIHFMYMYMSFLYCIFCIMLLIMLINAVRPAKFFVNSYIKSIHVC